VTPSEGFTLKPGDVFLAEGPRGYPRTLLQVSWQFAYDPLMLGLGKDIRMITTHAIGGVMVVAVLCELESTPTRWSWSAFCLHGKGVHEGIVSVYL
jgi:hypothetical protein